MQAHLVGDRFDEVGGLQIRALCSHNAMTSADIITKGNLIPLFIHI